MTLEKYNKYINGIINSVSADTTLHNMGVVNSMSEVCGQYGVKNGSKQMKNWNDVTADIDNITQYWCIY